MEIYDRAHELGRALARSPAYGELCRAKAKVRANAEALRMLNDYRQQKLAAEMLALQGQELPPEKKQALATLEGLVGLNPSLHEYLAAEARLAQVIGDIQRIIWQALPELADTPD